MTFSRLTLLEGVTVDPVISPDGKWVAYAISRRRQPGHLLAECGRTGGDQPDKAPGETTRSRHSRPTASRIAFRSSRDGGGLFVMGRTGESVRRLTPNGFTPAWFPDGQRIVYATANDRPSSIARGGGPSDLWVVDCDTEESRGGSSQVTQCSLSVSPQWSPNRVLGDSSSTGTSQTRHQLESATSGPSQRTARTPSGSRTRNPTDWNPVWSPDGRWLYFLSNRSGSMNLWRIAIDEGERRSATGAAQPLSDARTVHPELYALCRWPERPRYSTLDDRSSNLSRVRFNPQTATTQGDVAAHYHRSARPQPARGEPKRRPGSGRAVSVRQQEDLYLAGDRTAAGSCSSPTIESRDRGRQVHRQTAAACVFNSGPRGLATTCRSIDRRRQRPAPVDDDRGPVLSCARRPTASDCSSPTSTTSPCS